MMIIRGRQADEVRGRTRLITFSLAKFTKHQNHAWCFVYFSWTRPGTLKSSHKDRRKYTCTTSSDFVFPPCSSLRHTERWTEREKEEEGYEDEEIASNRVRIKWQLSGQRLHCSCKTNYNEFYEHFSWVSSVDLPAVTSLATLCTWPQVTLQFIALTGTHVSQWASMSRRK